jgi:hypothetical protein
MVTHRAEVPGGIGQRGAVHDLARVSHEHAQHRCFPGGEVHDVALDARAAPRQVELHAVGLEYVLLARRGSRRG